MDAALTAFLITLGIVMALASPLILIALIGTFGSAMKALAAGLEAKVEEIKKRPPFDEVEVNVSPATNVMTARFIKDGNIVWQGSSSRRAMEENGTLEFTTESNDGR